MLSTKTCGVAAKRDQSTEHLRTGDGAPFWKTSSGDTRGTIRRSAICPHQHGGN
jgi:hypothetical protein